MWGSRVGKIHFFGMPDGPKIGFQLSETDSERIWENRFVDHFGPILTPHTHILTCTPYTPICVENCAFWPEITAFDVSDPQESILLVS